ncbi:MAG TPA: sulfite exporter TauE/SafE family protein, partial [Candidatus Thermoplasmatota archaeon]|nr:sulfite exporter TauE/SafE family protein [Candidatus Thermoplasmatota archaeon]
MDPLLAAALLAVGLAAGAVSSLLGVGGGLVMVPVLHYAVGVEWHEATALSLAAIAVQSPTGVLQHARRGAVSWPLAVPLAAGGLAGVFLGAWAEPRLGVPLLKGAFALLMLFAAYRLLSTPRPHRLRPLGPAPLLLLGAAAGVVAKLLGIGGGLLTVPVLALLGTAVHVAVGSSLVAVFTNAAVATGVNLADGLSSWWLAIPLALGGLAGVPLGARAAHALPERGLRR